MAIKSKFFLAAFLLATIPMYLHAQTSTGVGGGGGGGGADPLTAQLAVTPGTILVGKTVTFQAVAAGGTPDYSYRFAVICTPPVGAPAPAIALGAAQDDPIWSWCANRLGSNLGVVQVTDDAGATAIATNVVTVLGPNKIEVVNDTIDVAFSANGVAIAEFKFAVKRDDEEIGGCLDAPVYMKVWDDGANEPATWQGETGNNFYFTSPLIYLTRTYTKPADYDTSTGVLLTKKIRLKISIPKCQTGSTPTESGVFIFKVTKKNATEVTMTMKPE